ncbi:hypothetical protein H2248_002142 [Termitomyces sp. 'cryptogamus']|nr:hypothetical protein H2248_002142 [Termitomyces sp. 'cryptogamus']
MPSDLLINADLILRSAMFGESYCIRRDRLLGPSRTISRVRYNDSLVAVRIVDFFLKDFWDHAHDDYLGSTPYNRLYKIRSCLNHACDTNKEMYTAIVALSHL